MLCTSYSYQENKRRCELTVDLFVFFVRLVFDSYLLHSLGVADIDLGSDERVMTIIKCPVVQSLKNTYLKQ